MKAQQTRKEQETDTITGMPVSEGKKEHQRSNRFCNRCGRELQILAGGAAEEAFMADKTWGYFSGKDLERHHFTLCEKCYDELLESFRIPIVPEQVTEVL